MIVEKKLILLSDWKNEIPCSSLIEESRRWDQFQGRGWQDMMNWQAFFGTPCVKFRGALSPSLSLKLNTILIIWPSPESLRSTLFYVFFVQCCPHVPSQCSRKTHFFMFKYFRSVIHLSITVETKLILSINLAYQGETWSDNISFPRTKILKYWKTMVLQ